jgi:hypothetical protein
MLRKNKIWRSLAATAAVAGSLACLAGPAQAYDKGNCDRAWGSNNIVDSDSVRVDGGKVDFGDLAHWGGVPLGSGVVCFHRAGSAAVFGRLFADSSTTLINAQAVITYFDDDGSSATYSEDFDSLYANSIVIARFAPGAPTVFRVRIRLYKREPFNAPREWVATLNAYRGD